MAYRLKRRTLLQALTALSTQPILHACRSTPLPTVPLNSGWPLKADWERFANRLEGHLSAPVSPFRKPISSPESSSATQVLQSAFSLGDEPALTQSSGWLDAWTSQCSPYAVHAETATDVATAVNFARQKKLRLVVKGGGHSYQGRSNAPNSLLVWTRLMNQVELHTAFTASGCPEASEQPAAGALWIDAYNAVTTQAGRYVQGGGCTTVGVAGLIQSGGFGNFSKNFGIAAAGLLEAEVVTANGTIQIANACQHPDLFWALKGGGGGTYGIVTRVTLRTLELPETFGAVFGTLRANSNGAFRILIAKIIEFYANSLFNPHWGEQIGFHPDNRLKLSLVFQGLTREQAKLVWVPFRTWIENHDEYTFEEPLRVLALPAKNFWNAKYINELLPGALVRDPRPNAPKHHVHWKGDTGEVGWFIHGYKSAWVPQSLLHQSQQESFAEALYQSTRHWAVALHFNKGLAGAPANIIEEARKTATNPDVLNAFALAIVAGGQAPVFEGMSQRDINNSRACENRELINKSMQHLRAVMPNAGSYVSESDYFCVDWQQEFWGSNYARLLAIKRQYDPNGLFTVHHGVGSAAI